MFFKASLDITSKIITTSIALFDLILLLTLYILLKDQGYVVLIPVIILSLTILFTYLYQPLGYEITNDQVEIHRRINKFYINRTEIISVKTLSDTELGRSWRRMGNGGMFGYTGYYSSSKQGKMRWFVSQRKNYVVLMMQNGKKMILSPDDPNGFVEMYQSQSFL